MAKSVALGLAMIFVALLMVPMVLSAREERILNNRNTRTLTVYYEDITGGPLINLVAVAGPPGQPRTPTTFGVVYVTNAPARQGISRSSPQIGTANGIQVVSSRNGNQQFLSFSLLFNGGSTMEFQGLFGNEISLVGGTKEYWGVEGYASLETVLQDPARNSSIVKSVIVYKFNRD